jgi:hypothetical protein
MFCLCAVGHVTGPEGFDGRDERVEVVQSPDRGGDHRHQLAFLLAQIVGKERPHLRGDLEQAIVEQVRGGFLDGNHKGEAGANPQDVIGRDHRRSPER